MVTDDTQMGWNLVDTGLTIANPAYGLYRLFGGRSAWGDDGSGPRPTATVHDVQKTAAYRAIVKAAADAQARGASADEQKQAALQVLQQMRSAAAPAYTPIPVQVPSFSLGRRRW